MGVLKKSLHTWQRSADSRGERAANGVGSQSVLSGTDSRRGMTFSYQRQSRQRSVDGDDRYEAVVLVESEGDKGFWDSIIDLAMNHRAPRIRSRKVASDYV